MKNNVTEKIRAFLDSDQRISFASFVCEVTRHLRYLVNRYDSLLRSYREMKAKLIDREVFSDYLININGQLQLKNNDLEKDTRGLKEKIKSLEEELKFTKQEKHMYSLRIRELTTERNIYVSFIFDLRKKINEEK